MTYEPLALGYARVSTAEQAGSGYSLGAQRVAIEEVCKARGWKLEQVYQDAASGKDQKRPGLQELLLDIRRGDVVVVAKLDRLSRSISDFSKILERSEKEGWSLVVIDFGLDLTSPHGRMFAHMLMAFAQWEREMISQRTKEGKAEKFRRTGIRPKGPSERVPQWKMQKIHELLDQGLTQRQVAVALTEAGVPTGQGAPAWQQGTISQLLKREREDGHINSGHA